MAALGTIGVASAGAGLGTSAYFSDQETFENNSLVAGTLDLGVGYTAHYSDWSDDEDDGLQGDVHMYDGGPNEVGDTDDLESQVGSDAVGLPSNDAWLIAVESEGDAEQFLDNTRTGSYPELDSGQTSSDQSPIGCAGDGPGAATQADDIQELVIDLDDVKPGDFGEVTFDFILCDNPGYVWLNGELVSASENGVMEPEADDSDEDQVEGNGNPALKDDTDDEKTVELLDVVRAAVWVDDGNNYQNGGEDPIKVDSLRNVLGMVEGDLGTFLNASEQYTPDDGRNMGDRNCFSASTEHSLVFAWWVPIDHGNEIQSDTATFNIGLYTEQCRHNDGSGMNSEEVSDGNGGTAPQFDYTFESTDDVTGSSLTGIEVNYPSSSGAVSGASLDSATLGGQDVSGDASSASTSNNGDTLTISFGGNYSISDGDELAFSLSGVSEPSGSYSVNVVVNPQSGQTSFTESF